MKWGIRRYQPYSVKPRGSGKTGKEIGEAKSYGKASGAGGPKFGKILSSKDRESTKLSKSINSYLDTSSALQQYRSEKNRVNKNLDAMESSFDAKPNIITESHQDPVSDAGLRALFKMQGYYDIGWKDSYEEEDPDTKASIQEWFAYEDQTIGLWEISNLVKKGKTAKDIRDMVNQYNQQMDHLNSELDKVKEDILDRIKSNPDFNHLSSGEIRYAISTELGRRESVYDDHEHLWSLIEADREDVDIDKYVSCLEEAYGRTSSKDTKKSSTSDTKQQRSRVRALKSSGYSYAEIAKRLGISEGAVSYYLNS